jgi:hypothetical protein
MWHKVTMYYSMRSLPPANCRTQYSNILGTVRSSSHLASSLSRHIRPACVSVKACVWLRYCTRVKLLTDVTYSTAITAESVQWPVSDLATKFNFRQWRQILCLRLPTDAVEKEKYPFLVPEVKARFLDGTPHRLPTVATALCRLPFDCTTLSVTSTV